MKIELKTIVITGKDDIKELLFKNCTFDYPELRGLTQTGSYVGDIRPFLDLMEIVTEHLQDVQGLRAAEPDLLAQFSKSADEFQVMKTRFIECKRILKEYRESTGLPKIRSK